MTGDDRPTYWLPKWWDWIEDWSDCRSCLRQFGTPCVSCKIPPGLLGIACLVGGGTATVAGNLRGNQTITSPQQARAAQRATSQNVQVNVQPSIDSAKTKRNLQRLQERKTDLANRGGRL